MKSINRHNSNDNSELVVPTELFLPPLILGNLPGVKNKFSMLARRVSIEGCIAEQQKFLSVLKETLQSTLHAPPRISGNAIKIRRSVLLNFAVKKEMEVSFFFSLEAAMEMAGFVSKDFFFIPKFNVDYFYKDETLLHRGLAICQFISTYPVLETISFKPAKDKKDIGACFIFRFHMLEMNRGWYPVNYQQFFFQLFNVEAKEGKVITRVQLDAAFHLNKSWLKPLVLRWFRGRISHIIDSLAKLRSVPPRVVWEGEEVSVNTEWGHIFATSFFGKGRTSRGTMASIALQNSIERNIKSFGEIDEGIKLSSLSTEAVSNKINAEKKSATRKIALLLALVHPRKEARVLSSAYVLQDSIFVHLSPLRLMTFFKYHSSMSMFFEALTSLSFSTKHNSLFSVVFGRRCVCGDLCEITKNFFLLGGIPCSYCNAVPTTLKSADIFVWFQLDSCATRRPLSYVMRNYVVKNRLRKTMVSTLGDKSIFTTNIAHWFCCANFKTEVVEKYFLECYNKSKQLGFENYKTNLVGNVNMEEKVMKVKRTVNKRSIKIDNKVLEQDNTKKERIERQEVELEVFSVAIKIMEESGNYFWRNIELQSFLVDIANQFNGRLHDYDYRRGASFLFSTLHFAYGFLVHLLFGRKNNKLPFLEAPRISFVFFLFSAEGKFFWNLHNFSFSSSLLDEIIFIGNSTKIAVKNKKKIITGKNNDLFCVSEKLMNLLKTNLNIRFVNGFTKLGTFASEIFFCSEN